MENIELPIDKGLKDEAFSALQFFMPGEFVRTGKTLYSFARAMDDIADEMTLPVDERLRRLNIAAEVLRAEQPDEAAPATAALRQAYEKQGLSVEGPLSLLDGFRRDVEGSSIENIDDLLVYVRQSSAAFSLYLIDFHKEDEAFREAAIQQGMSLQLMKLVKDTNKDWSRYQRNYVPGMSGDPATDIEAVSDGHLYMLNRALDLLEAAADLANQVEYWRLSVMIEVLHSAARRWNQDLREGNPLEKEIDLDWSVIMATGMKAVAMRMFSP